MSSSPSGGFGNSTFVRALLGLSHSKRGAVLVGGVRADEIHVPAFRSVFGVVHHRRYGCAGCALAVMTFSPNEHLAGEHFIELELEPGRRAKTRRRVFPVSGAANEARGTRSNDEGRPERRYRSGKETLLLACRRIYEVVPPSLTATFIHDTSRGNTEIGTVQALSASPCA